MNRTFLKVNEIKNNPNNPRLIKDDKFKKLVQSLKQLPIMLEKRPVIIDENNVIIGGNMRHKAAKEAGLKEVPVETFTRDDAERNNAEAKKLDTDYIDKSYDEQVKEMVIKDNVSGGEWDWDILANEWDADELDEWGLDTPDTWGEEAEIEEDEALEVDESEPPKSKLGEVYQLGRHRVMCADSTVKENVEKLMDGNKADMVFTDPPYGMDLDTDYTKMGGSWNKQHTNVIGDDKDFDIGAFNWIECDEQIWFGANYYAKTLPDGGSWYVWDKRVDENYDKMFGSAFELAWSKTSHKQEIVRVNASLFGTSRQDVRGVHPTQKPLQVCSWFIERLSKKSDIVLDPFLGSGSTLIACEQTDRTCYGMELDPKYVDVIRKRYHKFVTGSDEGWEDGTPAV